MSGLCQDCIIKLRTLAALRMSASSKDRDVREEAKTIASELVIGRSLAPEVQSILREIHYKLNVIKGFGGNVSDFLGGYNNAVAASLGRDYPLALDNVISITEGVNTEYYRAVASMGYKERAQEMVREAKGRLDAMEGGLISAPAPMQELDKTKAEVGSAIAEAEKRIQAKDYKGALEALSRQGDVMHAEDGKVEKKKP